MNTAYLKKEDFDKHFKPEQFSENASSSSAYDPVDNPTQYALAQNRIEAQRDLVLSTQCSLQVSIDKFIKGLDIDRTDFMHVVW